MFPLSAFSAVLLCLFILFLYRKDVNERIILDSELTEKKLLPERKRHRIYLVGVLCHSGNTGVPSVRVEILRPDAYNQCFFGFSFMLPSAYADNNS